MEILVRNAVPAFVFALVDVAPIEKLEEKLLNSRFVKVHGRPDEEIRLAGEVFGQVDEADDDLIGPGPGIDAVLDGCFLHFLAVLVRAGEKKDLPAAHLHEAGQGVGDDGRVGVADMGNAVDVVDRRRDVERGIRLLFHWSILPGSERWPPAGSRPATGTSRVRPK